MTLEDLQKIFPSATAETWHQHKNPDGTLGGWVNNKSTVSPSAILHERAVVLGNYAIIGSSAIIKKSPLYIIGSMHLLSHYRSGEIAIGCHVHPIGFWLKHYAAIGR